MTRDEALQLAATAWCQPTTSGIPMDVRLAEAFADILTEIPDATLDRMDDAFRDGYRRGVEDAAKVVEDPDGNLPGGTFDRLCIEIRNLAPKVYPRCVVCKCSTFAHEEGCLMVDAPPVRDARDDADAGGDSDYEVRESPCTCGSVYSLDEDGCCRTCGIDWNYELAIWQDGRDAARRKKRSAPARTPKEDK